MAPRIVLLPLFLFPVVVALTGFLIKQPAAVSQPRVAAAAARSAAEAITPEASPSDHLMAGPLTSEEARRALAQAEAQRANGQHEAAIATLQPFLDHADPTVAAEAGLKVALLRLELGYPKEAAGALESLLARFPGVATADRASFLLGVAKRRAGDCGGALGPLTPAADRGGPLAPYASFQLALCYRQLGDAGAALARSEEAITRGGPRLLKIEALEEQAEILEAAGDPLGALVRWEQLVGHARSSAYKAESRLTAARLSRQVGREAEAINHYAAVVNDVPTVRGALTALNELVAMGAADRVSYFQAGQVRYWAREYGAAIRNFDGALATQGESSAWGAAAYLRAAARLRQGSEGAAVADLLALPGWFPSSQYAPQALLRAGKILESNGDFGPAADAYRRLVNDYATSKEAREGLFRLGVSQMLRSAPGEASAAWSALEASDASAELKSLGLLWQGKLAARDGRQDMAHASWQAAAAVGPTWYGGIRARGLLAGNDGIQAESVPLDHARLEPSVAELAELDAWLAGRGTGLEASRGALAADAGLLRADELLTVGLELEAGWEVDELSARLAGDPGRLAALALWLHERGLHNAALKQAQATVDTARVGAREAPIALRKLLYPLPWTELFTSYGERYGANPLVFASLVRQESHFEVAARSSADARGLTQVMPATGREIAGALGRRDWQVEDLYKPAVSLEFGAFYFGQRLKRFGGALFPALAAYNAGDGAVDRWIRDYGTADMDVFAERIPYEETNHYIKVIFENYGMYRELYGAR